MRHIAIEVCRSALILVGAPVTPQSIDAMHGVLMAQRDQDVERAREEISRVSSILVGNEHVTGTGCPSSYQDVDGERA